MAKLLGALDHERLRTLRCFFGGGTAIALETDEYRESADVDFLCADKTSYRAECLSKLDIGDDWAAALTAELISSRWLHSGGWTS